VTFISHLFVSVLSSNEIDFTENPHPPRVPVWYLLYYQWIMVSVECRIPLCIMQLAAFIGRCHFEGIIWFLHEGRCVTCYSGREHVMHGFGLLAHFRYGKWYRRPRVRQEIPPNVTKWRSLLETWKHEPCIPKHARGNVCNWIWMYLQLIWGLGGFVTICDDMLIAW
jgi:hypothetical protein